MLILNHDPRWATMFVTEKARLEQALGVSALRVEHHGSTAVRGLPAKPIIDIQISVESLRPLEPLVRALSAVGYIHVQHRDDARCPFFHQPAQWPHTHHVHLVEAGGEEEARTLAFRDYLRTHSDVADEYARLKRELAGRFDASTVAGREAYAEAKSEFIERVTSAALRALRS